MMFTKNMADEPIHFELVEQSINSEQSLLVRTQLIALRNNSEHTLENIEYLRNIGLYNNKQEYRLLAIQALRASNNSASVNALHAVLQRYKYILQEKLRENMELPEILAALTEKGERKSLRIMLNLDEPRPIQITFNK